MSSLRDRLLDASVLFSFDGSGFSRHSGRFDPHDLEIDLAGKRVLITGANSGLGKSAAHGLAGLGAEIWLLCRDRDRGERALEDLRLATGSDSHRLELVDLSDLRSVESFARRYGDRPVDALVHNAGILPSKRQLTADGIELSWATNVTGPFLLTALLLPNLGASAGARVVNVSSGGMYLKRLDLSDLRCESRPFDGVASYANTKRAEVILTELWAAKLADHGIETIDVNAMHPGWAQTPGVERSLPRFWRLMRHRLRSPREGSDTIVWLVAARRLAGTTGRLFFDRETVPTHVAPWTRERRRERELLWQVCREQCGVDPDIWVEKTLRSSRRRAGFVSPAS